jgi:repressor LexA
VARTVSDPDPRTALATLAAARGDSLAALSAMLGRNAAYLQQYVRRGSPRVLGERDRRLLSDYLGVSEATLGAPADRPAGFRIRKLDVAARRGRARWSIARSCSAPTRWTPASRGNSG